MKLLIATFVFFLSAASGFSAAPPPSPTPGQWTPIELDRDPGPSAIGFEPLGGAFTKVLEPNGTMDQPFMFSIFSKKQVVSILSIYATNQSFIPLEKPLARVRLKTLKPGEMRHRIFVSMKWSADRKLLISAWDQEYHYYMGVRKLTAQEVQMAKLKEPLPDIAGGPGKAGDPDTAIKQYIGVRGTGGIFQPLLAMLPNGKLMTTDKAPGVTYIRTAFPGARTADVTLFAGNSPFIEKTETYDHYIISGMTNPERKNAFRLELQVKPNGKMKLVANELEPGAKPGKGEYKNPLTVDRYSHAVLDRLLASGQLGQSTPEREVRHAGHIPADPLQ